jgi:hypothetical protein
MTIKQLGGVFGRNPTFNDVTIEGQLTFDGDIDVGSDLKIDGDLNVIGTTTLDGPVDVNMGNNIVDFSSGDSGYIKIQHVSRGGDYRLKVNGATADYLDVQNGASQKLIRMAATGDVTIYDNLVIGTSGNGIDFSATAGAGTSELLSDYEEGTFSPTYTTSGTDFDSVSYVVVYGNYVKIGTLVYATGFIRTSSITVGSASGTVRIGGLPFARTGSMAPPVYISGAEGWGGDVPIGGLVNTDQTITLQYRTAANTSYLNTAITDLATSGSNDIRFTAMYRVSY